MKKIIIIIIIVFVSLFVISSCYQRLGVYNSGRTELYSIACFSVPYISGDPDWDRLEEVDKDSYGRILYKYRSSTYALNEYNGHQICAMLICQKSDKDYAYYYENYSFIMSKGNESFSDEEVAQLKEWNDWNAELDESKMSKVNNSFSPYSDNAYYNKENAIQAISPYLKNKNVEYFLDLIAIDADERRLFALREYNNSGDKYEFFNSHFIICDADFKLESENGIMKIEDMANCQNDMRKIKELNNWESNK